MTGENPSGEAAPIIVPAQPDASFDYDGAIRTTMDRLIAAPTTYAKNALMINLELLQLQNCSVRGLHDAETYAAHGPIAVAPGRAACGDAPGRSTQYSPGDYHFTGLPPGTEIVDEQVAFGLKTAMAGAGIPPEYAGLVVQNAARHVAAGSMDTAESYDAAISRCKDQVIRTHGDNAGAILRDGVAYLNALADKNPALSEAVALALLDPWSIATAANHARQGGGRR